MSSVDQWTLEELSVLKENSSLPSKEILELLPSRSYHAIVQKRKQLGLQRVVNWEDWEVDILKSHQYLSSEEIHESLLPTRSIEAIKSQRAASEVPHMVRCSKCGLQIKKNNQYNICPDCKKTVAMYNKSLLGRYRQYRHGAKRRGITWDLSIEDFSRFWMKPCVYCGSQVETIGIDRVDNTQGYTPDNCVSCCHVCNEMKLDHSKEKWFEHMKNILVRSGVIYETS